MEVIYWEVETVCFPQLFLAVGDAGDFAIEVGLIDLSDAGDGVQREDVDWHRMHPGYDVINCWYLYWCCCFTAVVAISVSSTYTPLT